MAYDINLEHPTPFYQHCHHFALFIRHLPVQSLLYHLTNRLIRSYMIGSI